MPPLNRRRRNVERDPTIGMTPPEKREYVRKQRVELSLSEAGLSVRSVNGLEEEGIYDVKTLLRQSKERLMGIKNLGEKAMSELKSVMLGLDLEIPDSWTATPVKVLKQIVARDKLNHKKK